METGPLAITMGDPAGIGAEIVIKALSQPRVQELGPVVVIGSADVLLAARTICGSAIPVIRICDPTDARPGRVNVIHVDGITGPVAWGELRADYGDASFRYVSTAIGLALEHKVAAVATAPVNKAALHLGGHIYSGHTEIFTQLTGAAYSCMMLIHGAMRVSHVTTHVPLKTVSGLITMDRVHQVIRLTDDALWSLGVETRRIGVAGLNPHCGEGGIFGTEDDEHILPAVKRARQEGIHVDGPVPGDTLFVKARAGIYDAAIAMFHDQGHIPVKLLGFEVSAATKQWTSVNGINVTLGLPIVRTSVDHGTAYDIAGSGVASSDSLVEALEVAALLARSTG